MLCGNLGSMDEALHLSSGPRNSVATLRVSEVAAAQWGAISWAQLRACGLSGPSISRAVRAGRLHRLHPRVYAVGHANVCLEGRLVAALLYAGPGAALSHGTAAWVWRLTEREPALIDVSKPLRRNPRPGLRLHTRRGWEACRRRRFPVTTVRQTLLDLAATDSPPRLRRTLAEADFRGLLDPVALAGVGGQGRPGTTALRDGLAAHLPALALTRSELEQRFLELCTSAGIPVPQVNATVAGLIVDMYWPDACVVVELDGVAGHGSAARVGRDHERDLTLRSAGLIVLRYTWPQITGEPAAVVEDLGRTLTARRARALASRAPPAPQPAPPAPQPAPAELIPPERWA